VEQRAEKPGLQKLAGDLPVMEGARQSAPAKQSANAKDSPAEVNQETDDEK
jgi:hypothetical protein